MFAFLANSYIYITCYVDASPGAEVDHLPPFYKKKKTGTLILDYDFSQEGSDITKHPTLLWSAWPVLN